MIDEALYTLVTGAAAVSAQIGTRMYAGIIPESAALPAVAYQRISAQRDMAHDGPTGVAMPRYQFSIVASTYYQAVQIGDEIRKTLNGYTGTVGGVEILYIELLTDALDYGRLGENQQLRQDYYILHKESVA